MAEIGTDWRVVDGVATAWFDAPLLSEGAALAERTVELSGDTVVDLRATGVRVRLDSRRARRRGLGGRGDLGLAADQAALQRLSVVFESADPTVARPFWQRVLDDACPGRTAVWRTAAAGPRDTDPAVDGAAAAAQPRAPRRGAAGRCGRAGGSW